MRVCCSPRGYNLNTPSPVHRPAVLPAPLPTVSWSLTPPCWSSLSLTLCPFINTWLHSPRSYGDLCCLPFGKSRRGPSQSPLQPLLKYPNKPWMTVVGKEFAFLVRGLVAFSCPAGRRSSYRNDPARQPGSLTCTGTPLTASGCWGQRCRGPPGTALCLCTAQSLEPAAVQDEVPLISRCDGRPGSCPPSPQASSCSAQRTPLGPHPKLTTPRPHRAPIFCPAV